MADEVRKAERDRLEKKAEKNALTRNASGRRRAVMMAGASSRLASAALACVIAAQPGGIVGLGLLGIIRKYQ